jgi:hypothetical protein
VDKSDKASFSSSQRKGRIYLLIHDSKVGSLTTSFQMEVPAVLDMKWCTHRVAGKIVLATADDSGCLREDCQMKNGKR